MKNAVVGLIMLCVLAGCAQTHQVAYNLAAPGVPISSGLGPSEGKAKIYVLRQSSFLGSGIAINIADTGKHIGKIGSGGVLMWERNPGYAVIGASASNHENISLAVEEGKFYFLEATTNWGAGFNNAAAEIQLLSDDDGQATLTSIRGQK